MDITGVVVNYNTPDLLDKAIESIRKFYDFRIIVIDGSEKPEELGYPNVEVFEMGFNIGHGLGMDLGIKMSRTKNVLTFDTDIEVNKPCIELMLEKMKEDTYAIGKLYLNDLTKYHKERPEYFDLKHGVTHIIHPSFQIVRKSEYLKYAPYISDGAPTVLSYHDILRHEKEKEILIDFPVLDYVYHRNAGTRDIIGHNNAEYKSADYVHWQEKWKQYVETHPIECILQ